MKLLQFFVLVLGALFTLLLVLASLEAPIWESFSRITEDLWGWATLADLYLGFVLLAIFIVFIEGRSWQALIWVLPLFFLGNIWSALWFVVRFMKIRERLGV